MPKVAITKSKLDALAAKIAAKSGESLPLTLDEMGDAVDNISGGGTDFIVNLIRNTQTNLWEPDKTLAEIATAYTAGKTISTYAELDHYPLPTDGLYIQVDNAFYFDIYVLGYESGVNFSDYFWGVLDANGITNEFAFREYDTTTATALPADVSNGKIFFNANGQQIGTLIPSSAPTLQAKTNIAPTESSQTITADSGFDGLSSVQINAISSSYVGSGITRRSSTDLTASGATVTVPAGYYDAQASKAVASGTEGTPTATKGTVSNHAVTVTPSVTNTAGYIAGGTHSGTGVSVSASELVSGTLNVTSSGTKDVTNYASASIPAGTVTAPSSISGTSATVSTGTNTLTLTKTVSVTPNVSTAGYISSGTAGNSSVSLQASVTTKAAATIHPSTSDQTIASGTYTTGAQTIKAVTHNLDASKILSGTTVKIGDSTDDDCVASVTGTYTGGSSKALYKYEGLASRTANSYGSTSATVTVTKAGTYDISYVAIRGSSSGTMGTNLHIGANSGTNNQTFNNGTYGQYATLTNQQIAANTTVTIYATSGSNSRTIYVGQLIVEEV